MARPLALFWPQYNLRVAPCRFEFKGPGRPWVAIYYDPLLFPRPRKPQCIEWGCNDLRNLQLRNLQRNEFYLFIFSRGIIFKDHRLGINIKTSCSSWEKEAR
jgi:hypothetical protein